MARRSEKANTEEEKKEVYGKYKKLQHGMAKKIMEKVEALPKDPAVGEVLMTVMQLALVRAGRPKAPWTFFSPTTPTTPNSVPFACAQPHTGEREKPLRSHIYGKTQERRREVQAAYALSQVLNKQRRQTLEQRQEAEKFLLEVKDNDKLGPRAWCSAAHRRARSRCVPSTQDQERRREASGCLALSQVLNKDESPATGAKAGGREIPA